MKYDKVSLIDTRETERKQSNMKQIKEFKKAIVDAQANLVKFIRKTNKYVYVGKRSNVYTTFEQARKSTLPDYDIIIQLSKNVSRSQLLNINN